MFREHCVVLRLERAVGQRAKKQARRSGVLHGHEPTRQDGGPDQATTPVIASEAKQSRIFPNDAIWIASALSRLAMTDTLKRVPN
jgi:hypothetical protein